MWHLVHYACAGEARRERPKHAKVDVRFRRGGGFGGDVDWLVKALVQGAAKGVGKSIAASREIKKELQKVSARMQQLGVPAYEGAYGLDVYPLRLTPNGEVLEPFCTAVVPNSPFRVYASSRYLIGCWRSGLNVRSSLVMHLSQGHHGWIHREQHEVRPMDLPEAIRAQLEVTVDQPQSVELLHRTAAGFAYIHYCHDLPHTSFQYGHGAAYLVMAPPWDYDRMIYSAQVLEQGLTSPPWQRQS